MIDCMAGCGSLRREAGEKGAADVQATEGSE